MRFGMINKAAKYPSIDEKNYTIDEFKEEIYQKLIFKNIYNKNLQKKYTQGGGCKGILVIVILRKKFVN